jgi:hypothetical protein
MRVSISLEDCRGLQNTYDICAKAVTVNDRYNLLYSVHINVLLACRITYILLCYLTTLFQLQRLLNLRVSQIRLSIMNNEAFVVC